MEPSSRERRHTLLAGLAGGALLLAAAGSAKAQVTGASAFEQIKRLQGEWQADWEGREHGGTAQPLRVRYEVTTGGTVVRETSSPGTPEEMTTQYYLDGDNLLVTHVCLFGNQPTMVLEPSLSTPDSFRFSLRGVANLIAGCFYMVLEAIRFISCTELRTHWATYQEGGGVVDTHEVLLRKVASGAPVCDVAFVENGVDATVNAPIGLESIAITRKENATVSIPGFHVGTQAPVVVKARKVDPGARSVVELRITDICEEVITCDPVLTLQVREHGKPATDTVSNLPQAEGKVTVINGSPGVTALRIEVNGTPFVLAGLADGEQRTADVSSVMLPGNGNTIVLTAQGKPGGSAEVIIHD
jgi:hypothetical protein